MIKLIRKALVVILALFLALGGWTNLVAAEDTTPPPQLSRDTIVNTEIELKPFDLKSGDCFEDFYTKYEDLPPFFQYQYRWYDYVSYKGICFLVKCVENCNIECIAQYNPIPYLSAQAIEDQLAEEMASDEGFAQGFAQDFAELTYSAGPHGSLKAGEETKYYFVKNATTGVSTNYHLRFQDLDTAFPELGGFTHPTPIPDPGYKFVGWKLEGAVTDRLEVMTGDVHATALFDKDLDAVPQTYTIVYDANGGAFPNDEIKRTYEYEAGAVIEIEEAPSWPDHKFLYWKGSQYDPGDSYTVTEDHIFVAQWEAEPITIFARPIQEGKEIIIPIKEPVANAPLPVQIAELPATGSVGTSFSFFSSLGLAIAGLLLKKRG